MVSNFTILLGLAINGFATGMGVIIAQTAFEWWIKPRVNKLRRHLKKAVRLKL